jgi:hypothetical protein
VTQSWEAAVRNVTLAVILIGVFGFSGLALANDITLPKYSADAVKAACDKAGGSFSQGATRYGCGTDCHGGHGTDCLVDCKAGQRCVAQVIGGRRPRNLENALMAKTRGK